MRSALTTLICAATAFTSVGCVVREYRDDPPPPPAPVVETDVAVTPGIQVVEVEPPPVERVYVYDPGYPPGCYVWNGFVYWGGRRYERNVFVDRVVNVNIRQNRYVRVEENHRAVEHVRVQHQEEYARTQGRRPAARPHEEQHHPN